MKVRRKYPIVVVKEKRQYWAYIPDIPGIYGRGKSAKKAKEDIYQALSLYIEDCLADGDKVPTSSAKVVDVDTLSIAVG
ncbi:MAG TPA: type II toxin-antitoxin system HicB family antitoxin [Candidatus Binatia bacterium]|jgi:predicted RNase H-like HicB family nuclease|nr:type II toxin-antitoxin system HicB family antitoxin [Candidatus Binatia bacterium]